MRRNFYEKKAVLNFEQLDEMQKAAAYKIAHKCFDALFATIEVIG